MAQIQIRDPYGNGIPLMNIRISRGDEPSDRAIYDVFTDYSGNTGWTIPYWPHQRYALHVNFANVNPKFVPQSYYLLESDIGDIRITLAEYMPRIDRAALAVRPRVGMNISSLLVNTKHNIRETLLRFVDAGVEITDVNWYSSMWPGVDCLPWKIPPAGQPFDLFDLDNRFFERAHEIRESFNAQGIAVQGTWWETYQSNRKRNLNINPATGLPYVPNADFGPWRFNVNGIKLWEPYDGRRQSDDVTLQQLLPTAVCRVVLPKILKFWDASVNPVRLGNELPEKSLHEKLRNLIRSIDPIAKVIVNRQEDTPGQPDNMNIGTDYDFIEIHGANLKSLNDLNRVWDREDSHVESYQTMLDDPNIDNWRITISSDGARTDTRDAQGRLLTSKDSTDNPYDWNRLWPLLKEMRRQGCSVLHQSRAKMTPAPNHHMIEVDRFKELVRA